MGFAGWIVMSLLASVGLVQVIGFVLCAARGASGVGEGFCVIPLRGSADEVECVLRREISRQRWCGRPGRLILLDTGLSRAAMDICEHMATESYGAMICTPEQLCGMLYGGSDTRA